MRRTRVLLADHHRSFAEALAQRLSAEPNLQVISAVVTADEALGVVRLARVDVAVLAVDGVDGGFVALGHALRAEQPHIKLIGVTSSGDAALLARAVRLGFRGWVPKDVGIVELLEVLQSVTRGETRIPPLLLTGLLDVLLQQGQPVPAGSPLGSLTRREVEVLRAMSHGATRLEIADELEISPNTVRTHTQNILTKLEVHTSLAAITLARRAGLL